LTGGVVCKHRTPFQHIPDEMKIKTLLIVIGVVMLLCVVGYVLFPVFVIILKTVLGLQVLIILAFGFFIGYLLSKILK
jgi:high-affinity K+ transport system ATPase subunit B